MKIKMSFAEILLAVTGLYVAGYGGWWVILGGTLIALRVTQ